MSEQCLSSGLPTSNTGRNFNEGNVGREKLNNSILLVGDGGGGRGGGDRGKRKVRKESVVGMGNIS